MYARAVSNGRGPGGRGAFQFAEQRAAKIEVSLPALQFEQKVIGFAIRAAILFLDGLLQMDQNLGRAGIAGGELVPRFQFTKLFFQLKQS